MQRTRSNCAYFVTKDLRPLRCARKVEVLNLFVHPHLHIAATGVRFFSQGSFFLYRIALPFRSEAFVDNGKHA